MRFKEKGKRKKGKGERQRAERAGAVFPFALCLFTLALLLAACTVDERRQLPVEAQATIDSVTDDIAAGRDEKIYEEAAEEWRRHVSPAENRILLERVRTRLGNVQSRKMHSGTESKGGSNKIEGHSLVIRYETNFERATGMETFTLLEREGRWLLAGYTVTSDALKE